MALMTIGKYPSILYTKNIYSCFIKFDYNKNLVERLKTISGARWVKHEKLWELPINKVGQLIDVFGHENLLCFTEFPEYWALVKSVEDLSQKFVLDKELQSLSINELKEYYANVKCDVDFDFKTQPMGHQLDCFNKCVDRDTIFITDAPGVGKSKTSIDILDYKIQQGEINRVLVICCVNSIKYNWVKEIETHSYNNCQVIEGTKQKRIRALHNCRDYTYSIINIESLRIQEVFAVLSAYFKAGVFDAVILDEIHRASGRKSKQGQAMMQIDCKVKVALTGTPITKRVEQIWTILNWLGIVRESYWNFVKNYCSLGGYSGWEVVGYKNLEELHKRLAPHQIRRTKEILNLPAKTHVYEYVEMSKKEQTEYALIKEGIIKDLETGEITSTNPMTVTIRLRQYTSMLKIAAIKELVEQITDNGDSCVIFSVYRDPVFELEKELESYIPLVITGDVEAGEARQKIINEFQNNPDRRVLIGTQQSMGTGITLTKSSYVIFLNRNWVHTENVQAEDRCHRLGTTDNVTVITVVVKDSIDERVEEILALDKRNIDKVVDGVGASYITNQQLLDMLMSSSVLKL